MGISPIGPYATNRVHFRYGPQFRLASRAGLRCFVRLVPMCPVTPARPVSGYLTEQDNCQDTLLPSCKISDLQVTQPRSDTSGLINPAGRFIYGYSSICDGTALFIHSSSICQKIQGKGEPDQGAALIMQRKPSVFKRCSGPLRPRKAERTSPESRYQEPPRTTRILLPVGPVGLDQVF